MLADVLRQRPSLRRLDHGDGRSCSASPWNYCSASPVCARYEKEYWKKKFGVSGQALAGAVRAMGPSVKKVEEYLKNK